MFESFNEELTIVKEKKRRSDKLKAEKVSLENSLYKEKNKLHELKLSLEKEGKDVEKLESFSFSGLFHSMIGKKAEKIEKEQQEYLTAKLKYDECYETVKALTIEEERIKRELLEIKDIDQKYIKLMKEKEEMILNNTGETTQCLIQIIDDISDMKADAKEIQEAIFAGRGALSEARVVIEHLESARSWGAWDMIGGGLISTAIKHSKIDDARSAIGSLQQKLRVFYRELKDVDNYVASVHIEIDSFLNFADYFFDGFFVDWMVQSKIVDSLHQAEDLEAKLSGVVQKLEARLASKKSAIASKEVEKQDLIERA